MAMDAAPRAEGKNRSRRKRSSKAAKVSSVHMVVEDREEVTPSKRMVARGSNDLKKRRFLTILKMAGGCSID